MKSNSYASFEQISKIEVELTNRCNASCPSCSRTDVDGKVIRSLPLVEISLTQFKRILPSHWISNREIKLCGVFGDPVIATDVLEIAQYILGEGGSLIINTNGGMRDTKFWKSLGQTLSQFPDRHHVIFSVDGLEETNHIYRRNVSWKRLVENSKSLIETGAIAHWDFLIFSHNEHQVDESREVAQKLGFKKFTLKKTTRSSEHKKPNALEDALGISPSQNPDLRHQSLKTSPSIQKVGFSPFSWWRPKKEIECYSRGESSFVHNRKTSIYISANLRVWPCCWYADAEFPQKREIRHLYANYGGEFNSLTHQSIDDVLKTKWFSKDLVKSWSSHRTCSAICSLNCSMENPLNNENCEDFILA